jgi:hypothetical protein
MVQKNLVEYIRRAIHAKNREFLKVTRGAEKAPDTIDLKNI